VTTISDEEFENVEDQRLDRDHFACTPELLPVNVNQVFAEAVEHDSLRKQNHDLPKVKQR
jgi:hypothetical protein